MRPALRLPLLALLAGLCPAPPAVAQTAPVAPPVEAGEARLLDRAPIPGSDAELEGTVHDAAGAPLAGATVLLPDRGSGARPGPDGRFRFAGLAPGRYRVLVRHPGYHPAETTLALARGERTRIAVTLHLAPLPLEGVEVRARADARRAGFLERRDRGRGAFLTREEIEGFHAQRLTDVLARLPRVHLVSVAGEEEIRIRAARTPAPRPTPTARVVDLGTHRFVAEPPASSRGATGDTQTPLAEGDCPPLLFLDGLAFDPTLDRFPARLVQVEEVEGIELYEPGRVPVQFRRRGAECGAILVWTRTGGPR